MIACVSPIHPGHPESHLALVRIDAIAIQAANRARVAVKHLVFNHGVLAETDIREGLLGASAAFIPSTAHAAVAFFIFVDHVLQLRLVVAPIRLSARALALLLLLWNAGRSGRALQALC